MDSQKDNQENKDEKVELEMFADSQPVPKLIFLGIMTLALCSFPPFTVLAPVPLTIAFLLFGKSRGLILGAIMTVILFGLGQSVPNTFSLGGVSAIMTVFYAFLISETINRKIPPVRGLMKSGFLIIGVITLIWLMAKLLGDFSIKQVVQNNVDQMIQTLKTGKNAELLKAGKGEEVRYLQDIVKDPSSLVNNIVSWLPATIFISIFISLWASFFLLLRNWPIWRMKVDYPHSIAELTHFKVPDLFVWPLIAGLILMLTGEYLFGDVGTVIGSNLLYMMGVFYFFQGFGIFLDFLTHLKVFGFFRTLMVGMGLMLAWRALVIVGVFDLWVDFRKFFKKKENDDKGDNV
ncbi:MAG: DUF2232 domain-containing protein [Bacteriovoracaceae bacterium]